MAKKRISSKKFSPHISRIIPAGNFAKASLPKWFSFRFLILLIFLSILLLQASQFTSYLYDRYLAQTQKQGEIQEIEAKITHWQEVVKEKPDYRDAYFELALLSYRLKRITEAKMYLEKVLELDPNYGPAKDFERILTR